MLFEITINNERWKRAQLNAKGMVRWHAKFQQSGIKYQGEVLVLFEKGKEKGGFVFDAS